MLRFSIALLVLTFAFAGVACGGDDEKERGGGGGGGGSASSAATDKGCKEGEGHLKVSDVLDKAPEGLQIVEADKKSLKPLTDPLRKALGDRLRGFDAKAVVPKGEEFGTAVVIANANEAIGDADEVLKGARVAAEQNDGKLEEITVAGNPAAFVDYGEASQISVKLSNCAVGLLVDQDKERLRAVADALHAPE